MTFARGLAPLAFLLATAANAQSTLPLPPINCTINPLRTVELSAAIPGIVAEVLVRPGSRVNKGDIIARLDTDLATADLDLAEARANFDGGVRAAEAQRDSLERRVGMLAKAVAQRAVSRVEYEKTLLDYEMAKSTVLRQQQDLEIARQEAARSKLVLEKAVIRSPVAGIVGEDLIDPGENVVNRPVATIYVTQPMRVEAFVPVTRINEVANLTTPRIIVNGDLANPVQVAPDYISPVASLSSNTISVYFVLKSDTIIPGYKCILDTQD